MTLASAVSAVPVLLVIWAVVVACFVGLLTYRGQLTRYENEQLYLSETDIAGEEERRNEQIVRRIQQIAPLVRVLAGAAALVTVGIVGIWVADAWRTLS